MTDSTHLGRNLMSGERRQHKHRVGQTSTLGRGLAQAQVIRGHTASERSSVGSTRASISARSGVRGAPRAQLFTCSGYQLAPTKIVE